MCALGGNYGEWNSAVIEIFALYWKYFQWKGEILHVIINEILTKYKYLKIGRYLLLILFMKS